ncbi:T9SS type A sorting domain-containing protein [Draconibacterium halophilum]|uniref:T9SS type A sorting domain-containing protein n=1 Tax=Draconibacterium halophilum TaxID=2706887 RepID=A0A6C0RET5_9BACT|nr:T9SS type A sorting domain-containing protein [Draconibacterium halophilum]QIA08195.1 T9SS type A sorting domain-containing protein [Draconibacterium halophilum]
MKNYYVELTTMNNYLLSVLKKWLFRCWCSTIMVMLFAIITPFGSYGQIVTQDEAVKANFGVDADVYANQLRVNTNGDTPEGTDDWFYSSDFLGPGLGIIDQSDAATLETLIKNDNNYSFERRMSKARNTTWNGNRWIDAVYFRDNNSQQNNTDASVFYTGSNKNADNPSTWNVGPGGTPQKNDLVDIMGHLRRDSDGNVWGMGAFTTISSDGNSHADFEFFRNNTDFVGGALTNTGNDGGHTAWTFVDGSVATAGDLIVTIDFENGGTSPSAGVRLWMSEADFLALQNDASGVDFIMTGAFDSGEGAEGFGYAGINVPDGASATAWAIINTDDDILGAPWGSLEGPKATWYEDIKQLQYAEFAINLTALGIDAFGGTDPCNKTLGSLFVKTRSSSSFTAELKDFGGPFLFGWDLETGIAVHDLSECLEEASEAYNVKLTDALDSTYGGTITYHLSESDANDLTGIITDSASYSIPEGDMPKTIWARSSTEDGECFAVDSFVVDFYPTPVCQVNVTDATYIGANDGTATAVIVNETTPGEYYYTWSKITPGDTTILSETTASIDGLEAPARYKVDIVDGNGCTTTCENDIVEQASAPTCEVIGDSIECFGANDGMVVAVITPAENSQTPYTILWTELSDPSDTLRFVQTNELTDTLKNVGPGRYFAEIWDAVDPNSTICNDTVKEAPENPVAVTCSDLTLESCLDQNTVDGHLSNWLDTVFTVDPGTEPMVTVYKVEDTVYDLATIKAMTLDACGDAMTVRMIVSDFCGLVDSCDATFMVSAAPAVTYDALPESEEHLACDLEDQAAMVQAFSDWVAAQELALNLGGGCSPVLDSDADQVVLNDLCLGDTVTVNWTINDKCIDEIQASAMFMVSAAPAVTYDALPESEEHLACDLEDQAAMVQAFSDWVAAQELALNLGGGCSPVLDSDADQVVLNDLCLGDTVTVNWTINDKCIDEIQASAMFMVSAAPAVTYDALPESEEHLACDLEDQAAMVQAFSDWVAAQELALNLGGGCSPVLDSDADQVVLNDLCLGDTVTVNWTINDKCIDEIQASAMFMVSAAPAVTYDALPESEEHLACDLEDQAAMVQAFSDWVAAQELALNLGGGCSPVLDSDADQVVLNDLCLGDTVTVNWTINDKCIDEIQASAMFMVSAAPAVTYDALPESEEHLACDLEDQAAMVQAFSDWVAAQELALNLGGGCSPVLDSDADQVVLNDLCLGDTVTVNWTINDKCIDEIQASAMFMVSAAPAVTYDALPESEEHLACDLEDQAAMVQAFSDWVAAQELALNLGGGCSPVLDSDADQVVLNDLCLGDTVTVNWTINDKCIDEIQASAMFMVSAAPAVTYDALPESEEHLACDLEDQAAMVQAFSDWVAAQELALNLGGGCSPVLDSDADQVVLNDLCLGDTVTVNWTINDKCIDEIQASAMFMVSAAPAVTYDALPESEEHLACDLEDQAAMVQAFSDWVAAQELALNLGGGCSPVLDSDADQVVLNDLCLGDTVTVNWTINDKCIDEIQASAMFMVSAAPAVTYDALPESEEHLACDLEDQAAMVQAFSDWVAAQELALNLGGGCSPVLDSDADQVVLNDLCLGDTVTVNWTINDKCIDEIQASAMFMVSAAPAVTYDALPESEEHLACDLEDQAAMVQAFSDWVAAQELALNLGGGCSPVLDSDADQVVLNDLCLGDTVTVNWTINDKCIDEIQASAMFMVSAAPAVTYDALPESEEHLACDLEDQAAMVQAFSDWVAAQELALNLGGGCSPVLDSDADQVVLNDLCLGDTVTVNWTINDKCIDEIQASAMFMVSAAPAVTYDALPESEEHLACDLEDQAAMVQAFSDWVAAQELALNLGGGCSPVLDSDADQVVLNDLCLGDTVTVNWTINDKCIDEIQASAMFMVSAAPAVTYDALPESEEHLACDLEDQAAMVQAFSDWVAAQELALNLGGGCSPVLDSDADQVVLNDLCLGDTVTVNWTINDKCIDEIQASAMFMVSAAPAVTYDALPESEEHLACDLEDQAAMVQAFSDWVAAQELALNLGGGCSPVLDSDADQVVLNDLCLGDTVTVNWTINDKCIDEIQASAMFMVSAAPAVTYDALPESEEHLACDLEDQAAMVQAFSDWVAAQELALNLGGGCSPVLDSDADQVVLNDLCLGDTVTVNWTINDKCIDEIQASAMFMVSAAPAVTYDALPESEEHLACDLEDQAAMVQAFSDWVAAQELALNLGGGCSPVLDSDADQVVLNDLCLGDTVTVNWTINDKCIDEIEASAMFMVQGDHELPVISTEAEDMDLGCNPLEIVPPVFTGWDNCDGEFEPIVNVVGGAIEPGTCDRMMTWFATYSDDCGNEAEIVSVTYTWKVDEMPPMIYAQEDSVICEGDIVPMMLMATWTDNCAAGGDLWAEAELYSVTYCDSIFAYPFYVMDDCENEAMDTVFIRKGMDKYENCETAFAKLDNENAHCFIGDYNFNRWGWTNLITEGEYDLPYYAGAGQCDISNGVLVGNVHVTFMNGNVSVEYQMLEGYVLSEAHVYVGCDPYPVKNKKPTVAPGQFTYNSGDLDHSTGITVNFTDVTTDQVYIIVHGVTCEEVCRCSERPGVDDGAVFDYNETIECSDEETSNSKGKKKTVVTGINDFTVSELNVFPNPFDEVVNFEFVPAISGHAVLEIHNMLGQRVVRLLDKPVEAGELQRVEFRPETEISGMYLYKLDIDGDIRIGKIIYRNK